MSVKRSPRRPRLTTKTASYGDFRTSFVSWSFRVIINGLPEGFKWARNYGLILVSQGGFMKWPLTGSHRPYKASYLGASCVLSPVLPRCPVCSLQSATSRTLPTHETALWDRGSQAGCTAVLWTTWNSLSIHTFNVGSVVNVYQQSTLLGILPELGASGQVSLFSK